MVAELDAQRARRHLAPSARKEIGVFFSIRADFARTNAYLFGRAIAVLLVSPPSMGLVPGAYSRAHFQKGASIGHRYCGRQLSRDRCAGESARPEHQFAEVYQHHRKGW